MSLCQDCIISRAQFHTVKVRLRSQVSGKGKGEVLGFRDWSGSVSGLRFQERVKVWVRFEISWMDKVWVDFEGSGKSKVRFLGRVKDRVRFEVSGRGQVQA